MIETTATIQSPVGLHARPAKELVNITKKFSSNVTILYQNNSAQATSMLQIMKMAIPQGGVVTISVTGEDEAAASQEITSFLGSFTD
ncbi:MAG: HPr family phosphocarrier protein [Spirochaetia bacterium]